MNKSNQHKTNKTKSKYKLNVHGGGIIYANSVFEMVYKIIKKQYEKNENSYLGRRKTSKTSSRMD